jgi:hypothetical protein
MRKLFWCCTAAGVVAAGGIYTAARYACCPQTLVSTSATVASGVVHFLHPLAGIGLAAGRLAHGPAAAETLTRAARDEAEVPDEPRPIQAAETERVGPAPIVIAEEEPAMCRPLAPETCEPAHPECAIAPVATGTLCPPATVDAGYAQPTECRIEDSVPPCPMVMPYCTDEEAAVEKAPPMPRADEESALGAAATSFFQFWVEGLKQGKEEQQTNGPAEGGVVPNCQEDEHYYEHYSGCPYTGYNRPSPLCPVTPIDAEPGKRPGQDDCTEEAAPKKHKVNHPGKAVQGEECPAHPDVDTMEYRRSDGGLNEYGPGPF